MPNWTRTVIIGNYEMIESFLNEKGEFDFNKAVPQPKELDNVVVNYVQNVSDIYYYLSERNSLSIQKVLKKPESKLISKYSWKELGYYLESADTPNYDNGELLVNNYRKYGFTDWYEWRYANWGTKWNAVDTYREDEGDRLSVSFETAWGEPLPIMEYMCKHYADESITFLCDDDADTEYRKYENKDGQLTLVETGYFEDNDEE